MKAIRLSLLATGFSLLLAGNGFAAEVFVVDAKGVNLVPGQVLDGTKPLVLTVGQRVTLVTADGRTVKLTGPSDAPPAPAAEGAGGDVVDSLKGLMKKREADTSSAGVIREGSVAFDQPSPWLVEIVHGGDRCQVAAAYTVFRFDRSIRFRGWV